MGSTNVGICSSVVYIEASAGALRSRQHLIRAMVTRKIAKIISEACNSDLIYAAIIPSREAR